MYLSLKDVLAHYGKKEVLHGVSLHIDKGEIVALMGHNGAGKSTTLRVIAGLLRASAGSMLFEGQEILRRDIADNVKQGITLVPQGRAFFDDLSVEDNLKMAGYTLRSSSVLRERMEGVYHFFPRLGERRPQIAGTLSGGEHRQLSVGMAMLTNPKLLLLDEPTYGLAPIIAEELLHKVAEISQESMTSVFLVEDNIRKVTSISNRAYVMKNGNIAYEGTRETLEAMSEEDLWRLF
jgi:branched-chain amino acid transport system ATP-binding protein